MNGSVSHKVDTGVQQHRRRGLNQSKQYFDNDSKYHKHGSLGIGSADDSHFVLMIPKQYMCLFYTCLVFIVVLFIIIFSHFVFGNHGQDDGISFEQQRSLIENRQQQHSSVVLDSKSGHARVKKSDGGGGTKKTESPQIVSHNIINRVPDPVPVFIPEYWTIFVAIYSFQNENCGLTIESLLLNATHSNRIHIGIYEEKDKDSVGCMKFVTKCNDLQIKHELYYKYLQQSNKLHDSQEMYQFAKKNNIIRFDNFNFLDDIPPLSKLSESDISQLNVFELKKRQQEDGGKSKDESIYKFTYFEYLYYDRVCSNMDNIEIDSMNWESSQGDSYGRYQSEEYFDDETFVLSIDANFIFVQGWDDLLIEEWAATNNEFAILTTHPKHVDDYSNNNGNGHLIDYMPVLCNTYFLDWSLRNMLQNNIGVLPYRYHPILSTLYSQAFNFGKGHRLSMVRNDPYYDSLMDGVEFDMAFRLFTFGYDFYAPHIFAVWSLNEYNPKNKKQKFKKQWQFKWKAKTYAMIRSSHRLRQKIGIKDYIDQDSECDDYDQREMDYFGVGDIRSINEYLTFAGIDILQQNVESRCTSVREGTLDRVPIINKLTRDDINLLRSQDIRKNQDHA